MACTALSASSSRLMLLNGYQKQQLKHRQFPLRVRAASPEADDCNTEECAPDKEVGTVSMEWLASEKTKVVGTFPPKNRAYTGYVEKDTAGQTNIYSVEPPVYIAESAISSGTSGSSADGTENTAAIVGGIALICLAAASSVLLQVGRKAPVEVQTVENYSGPSLSYYINKFKPPEIIETSAPPVTESSAPLQADTSEPPVTESSAPLQADTSEPPVTESSAPLQADTSAPSVTESSAPLQAESSTPEVLQQEIQVEPQQEAAPSDSNV